MSHVYRVDERVLARTARDQLFKPATVCTVHPDGTVDVYFMAGRWRLVSFQLDDKYVRPRGPFDSPLDLEVP